MPGLPREAQQTLTLIKDGGPFPYHRDGIVFRTRKRLPLKQRGYYHEYTVKTPGRRDRGARRIVTGAPPLVFYYTDDHYHSFREFRNTVMSEKFIRRFTRPRSITCPPHGAKRLAAAAKKARLHTALLEIPREHEVRRDA